MAARFDQFTERLGVGIDVDENLKSRFPPAVQASFELADVGIAQRGKTIRSLANKTFAGIEDHDRHILAWQPALGLERDPVRRHIGGEQRMTGGIGRLMAQIEQGDFLAQQQHAADFRGGDGGNGHEHAVWRDGNSALHGRNLYFNRLQASGWTAIIASPCWNFSSRHAFVLVDLKSCKTAGDLRGAYGAVRGLEIQRRPLSYARRCNYRLRDLYARPRRHRYKLESRGQALQRLRRVRNHRREFLALLHRGRPQERASSTRA